MGMKMSCNLESKCKEERKSEKCENLKLGKSEKKLKSQFDEIFKDWPI